MLTTENNNVKLPVAEQLVLVGDAGPEAARPPQGQSEQDLTLLLVEGNRLAVVPFQTVIIHGAQLEVGDGEKMLEFVPADISGSKRPGVSCTLDFATVPACLYF